jgi:hypothetical protein
MFIQINALNPYVVATPWHFSGSIAVQMTPLDTQDSQVGIKPH